MDRLKGIKCFLLDMDGTFYLGDKLLPGSLDFIKALGQKGIDYLFLTNNSSKDGAQYVNKLKRMGLETDRILTSGQAGAMYLNEVHAGQRVYVLGNPMLKAEMTEMGVHVVEEDAQAVLMGYDTTLTYEKLCVFCDYVRAGLPYIATHPDFNCPVDGGFEPDAGSFAALVEASTSRRPDVVVGKPNEYLVKAALAKTGHSADDTCMVGDRLYTDIATGLNYGMLSLLVLTGEATREDLLTTPFKPHLVFERLADIIPHL